MKIKSGGGIRSNKVVHRPMPKTSAPSQAITPAAVSRLGPKIGNHATGKGTVPITHPPLVHGVADRSGVQLGNAKATDVRGGGPGKGYEVHRSGGQGKH